MDNNCQIAQEGNAQTWLSITYFCLLLAKCVVSNISQTNFSVSYVMFFYKHDITCEHW